MLTMVIPRENRGAENRVAMVPALLAKLDRTQWQVRMEHNAGVGAGYPDECYADVTWCNAENLYTEANVILKVQAPTLAEIQQYPAGAILVGMLAPYQFTKETQMLAEKNITSFALEFIPRITRAQSMDVLSSQATVSGYKAVLMAANLSRRFFPMLTTAAGTIRPSTVLVIGAGVAGLQAIATAKRLGAIVEAYDIRPEAREQIESLGAKMVQLHIDARGEGGYARELTAEEKQQQQDILAKHAAKADIIICTAAIPGRPAPRIISKDMVAQMQAGSVIVDIAAEFGGNCELTQANETIQPHGVTICGPVNLPASMARDASDMYARNIYNFLPLLLPAPQWEDEIIQACALTHQNEIRHEATRTRLLQGVNA